MEFAFVSGNAALDLVSTVEHRRTDPVDLLPSPAALTQWVGQCAELPDHVAADTEAFEAALRLREALHDLALAHLSGNHFRAADLTTLNETAARRPPTPELTETGTRLTGDIHAALAQVARTGIAVLADPEAPLKECGAPACTRLYLDRSRGTRRTWCGMRSCGNRAKAATYRARKRTT